MERFENIRQKALELFQKDKHTIMDHALERMIERNIQYEDIESALAYGSIYKTEIDIHGDTRYNIRGKDCKNKIIRFTFIVKEKLIIITVIREQE